jgi:hypothetical protein
MEEEVLMEPAGGAETWTRSPHRDRFVVSFTPLEAVVVALVGRNVPAERVSMFASAG